MLIPVILGVHDATQPAIWRRSWWAHCKISIHSMAMLANKDVVPALQVDQSIPLARSLVGFHQNWKNNASKASRDKISGSHFDPGTNARIKCSPPKNCKKQPLRNCLPACLSGAGD